MFASTVTCVSDL